ncbi:hypothetical protein [Micromonospora sp. CPCC 205558]|uniref:hypothetical protein n=1 Tax=Micromonospora sp. CPCC 205558 TaxID=3122403 RepID=UPI002FF09CD4
MFPADHATRSRAAPAASIIEVQAAVAYRVDEFLRRGGRHRPGEDPVRQRAEEKTSSWWPGSRVSWVVRPAGRRSATALGTVDRSHQPSRHHVDWHGRAE